MATIDEVNAVLSRYGLSVGLSNDKYACGTMEWFEKSTSEFRGGFDTADEAYASAAAHILETAGEELPELDDNGEFPTSAINSSTEVKSRLQELHGILDEAHACLKEGDSDGSFLPDFREWLDMASADQYHAFNQQAKEYLALEEAASKAAQSKRRRP